MGVWFIPVMTLHIHQPVITLQIRDPRAACCDAEKQNMIVANFPSDELQITDLYKVGRSNL